ncbi:hypothetical protein C8R46DRAFT_1164650 [Mycena filopes]|nr:hypothetical protein C8R46DRAFT_1164650 [Mycena filopes]
MLSTVADYAPVEEAELKMALKSKCRDRTDATTDAPPPTEDPELRLPNWGSLITIIATNALLQVRRVVASQNQITDNVPRVLFVKRSGGSAVFAGLTIGIPTVFSGLALIPLARYDQAGSILHAVAYKARFLYLRLGFTGFMYVKRYCSDPRIIGIRRRTTLASWLVLTQAFGFSIGPFIGGLLYKVGFSNDVFNGYTRMAKNSKPPSASHQLTRPQWGVILSMCWTSMSCFFILGSWEANIPIYAASAPALLYTPYAAGNFIALGGIATLPFLLLSARYAPPMWGSGPFYVCWFLVALGFNLASTCTLSLLSKQLPGAWNARTSLAIQYSNYSGRVTGAVLGGAGVQIGMKNYIAVQLGVVGIGALLHATFWKQLKAKTG